MKSRTSFFNTTAFRKDMTRFAPSWGLYSVGLVMVLLVMFLDGNNSVYQNTDVVVTLIQVTAVVNLFYAFLNAQLLFGDLFSSRLCNALHALPLRRETWFGSHVAAGMAFSVLPNFGAVLLAYGMLDFGIGWPVMLLWLAAATLQYLCFFGIAVFCMMLSGNRLAAGLVYAIVNFLSLLVYWLLDSLYEPLLYGIRFPEQLFMDLSPVVWMGRENLVELQTERILDAFGNFSHMEIRGMSLLADGWMKQGVYSLVGVGMLALALVMYRKRNLECAGDFAAFKFAEPVLLITYTLSLGTILHLMADVTGAGVARYVFLLVGLMVGYFTGLMLLNRTARVFQSKRVLSFLVFGAVFLVTLVAAWVDPLGLTRWVPQAENVESVHLSSRYVYDGYSEGELTLTQEQQILDMIAIHNGALAEETDPFQEVGYMLNTNLCLEYRMKNGRVHTRFYEIPADSEAGRLLEKYYSSFEYVMGYPEEQIPQMAKEIFQVSTETFWADESVDLQELMARLDVEELLRCIAADCAEGNMAQSSGYHSILDEEGGRVWDDHSYLEIGTWSTDAVYGTEFQSYKSIAIYEECRHTMNWLIENGLHVPEATGEIVK